MIESTAASAAKSMTAPPAGPLSAPPKEIGESFAGAFGVDGKAGALGGAVLRGGATLPPGATGTSLFGTSVTPCGGTNVVPADSASACGCTAGCGKSGLAADWLMNVTRLRCDAAACARLATLCGFGRVGTGVVIAATGAGAATGALAAGVASVAAGGVGVVAGGGSSACTVTVISVVTLGPGAVAPDVVVEGVLAGGCTDGATVVGGTGSALVGSVVEVTSVAVVGVAGSAVVFVGSDVGVPALVVEPSGAVAVSVVAVVPPVVGSVTGGDALPSAGAVAVAELPSVVVELSPVAA